ncbi:intradiol ring-cleavage dioxygenase [Ekhidna sp. To15]|uniref:dioxygenase family protein n=1 Tax=Ekhidna sp. To15 TaxID=3395267 RepID=UPI003F528FF7
MKRTYFLIALLPLLFSCQGQSNQNIGGPFENAEFIFIDMPKDMAASDTTLGWFAEGQKLIVTGTIYKPDGITPAPHVILYYYHTDTKGYYSNHPDLDQRAGRHGYLRGWVKTDAEGKYAIHTIRPAAYPNSNEPAHIHPSILEPGMDMPYYIDEFVFDDDILLTTERRKAMTNRGGSGILRVLQNDEVQIAEHNIILGLNIPSYPAKDATAIASGRNVGEDVFSFTPYHVWGPDKGTKTCPICKYGRYHGILYFVGNHPNWNEIKAWLTYLEKESVKREQYLKAYMVMSLENAEDGASIQKQLELIGQQLNLQKVALTTVPSFSDQASDVDLIGINPKAANTLIIYKNSNIVSKFINLKPGQESFDLLTKELDRTKGEYFHLARPKH